MYYVPDMLNYNCNIRCISHILFLCVYRVPYEGVIYLYVCLGKLDSSGVVYHVACHSDDASQYHALSVMDHMTSSDTPGGVNSSTEGSSYGSNSSSQALLTHVEVPEGTASPARTDV